MSSASIKKSSSESWNRYWQGTGNSGAYTNGGVHHPLIGRFWQDFFNSVNKFEGQKILDIASGNGAVIESIIAGFEDQLIDITSLDISPAAIDNIKKLFPSVNGIVSDAISIPKANESFDIITSQFGVEYAGIGAIYEAARLVKKNGLLGLLLHIESGSIHLECKQSLDAIERVQKCQFIHYAIETFEAGFATVRGANRSNYENAAGKLAPSVKELENIMKQYGEHVAGDTIARIYKDVAQIHQRIQHYEPKDVLSWLDRMNEELKSYATRMSSMIQSAISNMEFNQIVNNLQKQGFLIKKSEPLQNYENDKPLAWVLIAKK